VSGSQLVVKSSSIVLFDRDILYVGGSGPNNYTRIQYALDDAVSGDTVYVFEGEYNELIVINNTINLLGENKATTIINGTEIGNVVTVNAIHVKINGFTIIYGDKHGIEIKSDNCVISDNIFKDHDTNGINIIDTDNHTISGNIFYNHGDDCIRAENSHYNIISDNTFAEKYGAKIRLPYCNSNIISDNQVSYGYRFLYSVWCTDLIIMNNTMFGYGSGHAMTLYDMINCTITGNIISGYNEGLWLRRFNHSTINNNEITNNDDEGIYFLEKCNFNVISNNIISGNGYAGIMIKGVSTNNTIIYNTINSNNYGINIKAKCDDYNIYHNNINNNTPNSIDLSSNIWNDSYPSGGNYWDDYNGADNDGDGIGDTPLNISGGAGNKDYYPLIYPWGEQKPVANYILFEEYGGYVFNASDSYDRDGEVVAFEWDFGDGTTDEGIVVAHSYNTSEEYDVTLSVTDDEGYKGNHTETIEVVKNYPPDTPIIDGPDSGGWGKPYYFTFQTTDNEGSYVWYYVEWGDGKDTGWMGPYISGDEITDSHTWTNLETFTIRCKAKDMYNVHSDWSEFEITIPRTRTLSFHWLIDRFPLLERLLFFIGINI
jgi:parallel beta-helix repeat protein